MAERGARVSVPAPLVFVVSVSAGVGVGYVLPLRTHLPRGIALIAAYLLLAAGLGLFISALRRFWRARQNPLPWTPTLSLEFSGPYRFTRNPMYVGMTLLQLGLGTWMNHLWVLLFALPALAVVHFTAVLPEEAYLIEKFGDPYRQYLSRVRRYL